MTRGVSISNLGPTHPQHPSSRGASTLAKVAGSTGPVLPSWRLQKIAGWWKNMHTRDGDFGDFGVSFAATVAGRYTRRGGPRLSVQGEPLIVLTRGP